MEIQRGHHGSRRISSGRRVWRPYSKTSKYWPAKTFQSPSRKARRRCSGSASSVRRCRVVCVNGIVAEPCANEIVVVRVVQLGPLESRRRRVVHPQGLDPGVADVAGIRRSGHARKRTRNRAAIARSEKLPLLQREVREFVNADEEKFGALIAIDVVFVAAKAEARGRAIAPGYDVLGFVVTFVRIARHIAAEIRE